MPKPPPAPRWRQILTTLGDEIAGGAHVPGAKLPTEAALAARFGANRHTVRRALEELQRGGAIRVEQGRGSFVAEDVLDYEIAARTRFSEWIRRHNKEPSGRTLDLREMPADATVAAGLDLAPGATVVRLERLGLADGRPVSLGSHHFPARLTGLLAALADGGISAALARCGVPDYRRQVSRVSARMPDTTEAALLRMAPNRPLLVMENVNVDPAGRPVEFCFARYPTPRVQIVFEP